MLSSLAMALAPRCTNHPTTRSLLRHRTGYVAAHTRTRHRCAHTDTASMRTRRLDLCWCCAHVRQNPLCVLSGLDMHACTHARTHARTHTYTHAFTSWVPCNVGTKLELDRVHGNSAGVEPELPGRPRPLLHAKPHLGTGVHRFKRARVQGRCARGPSCGKAPCGYVD